MKTYFKNYNGHPYVSELYLYQRGINQSLLDDFCKKFRDGKSNLCAYFQEGKWKWFMFHLLPAKWIKEYALPTNKDELHALIKMQDEDNEVIERSYIEFVLTNAWNDPMRWTPFIPYYRPYYLDHDLLIKFSKTHALFTEIIKLSDSFTLKNLFEVYISFSDAVFQTTNANCFSNKIKQAKDLAIEDCLMHDSTRLGRPRRKVTGLLLSRIKFYYCNPLRYSYPKILLFVNNEMMDRDLPTISLSTLKRVLQDRELRNICDPIRLGRKHAESNIYPHLNRKDPEFGELIQIDSTELNIPIKLDEKGKKIGYLWLCAVMEVHSRMIIGYSFSLSENTQMIMEALKKGFIQLGYMPKQLLHDNHKAFLSKEFNRFSKKLFELGVDLRAARVGNPKDKAHVERWFGTLQTEYLNSIFGSLGEGIKTKRVGGRAQEELEREYRKPENLRAPQELKLIVEQSIKNYNDKPRIENQSPLERKLLAKKDGLIKVTKEEIHKLFYLQKERVVRKSTVIIREKGNHHFVIYNRKIANKLNGLKVMVRYNPEDLSEISLYDIKTDKLLAEIPRQKKISPVASNKELGEVSKHYHSLKRRIKENLDELERDFNNGIEELDAIPTVALNSKSRVDEILSEKERRSTLKKTTKSQNRDRKAKKRASQFKNKGSLKPVKK